MKFRRYNFRTSVFPNVRVPPEGATEDYFMRECLAMEAWLNNNLPGDYKVDIEWDVEVTERDEILTSFEPDSDQKIMLAEIDRLKAEIEELRAKLFDIGAATYWHNLNKGIEGVRE